MLPADLELFDRGLHLLCARHLELEYVAFELFFIINIYIGYASGYERKAKVFPFRSIHPVAMVNKNAITIS